MILLSSALAMAFTLTIKRSNEGGLQ
jgi:hypothetical protein